MPVTVPAEVHEAFKRLKRSWSPHLDRDGINLMFLVLVGTKTTVGDALTLKTFAIKNPTAYMEAITNGYVIKKEITKEEVANMIQAWMCSPYKGESEDDIDRFAGKLINYFQQNK